MRSEKGKKLIKLKLKPQKHKQTQREKGQRPTKLSLSESKPRQRQKKSDVKPTKLRPLPKRNVRKKPKLPNPLKVKC